MVAAVDLCKQALAEIGTRSTITALNDGSTEANYCLLLYAPLRDFMLREGDYDFAMRSAPTVVPATTPPVPWSFIYTYPADAIRIRQLIPSIWTPLDPKPIEWNILTFTTSKYIVANQSSAAMLYTYAPLEDHFDPIFRESFVRLLSSSLAFALSNRIEASDKTLKEALTFAGIANLRDS